MTNGNMLLIYQPFSYTDSNLINYDDNTPNIRRALVKVHNDNSVTITTAANAKSTVDTNNNLKVKPHFGG